MTSPATMHDTEPSHRPEQLTDEQIGQLSSNIRNISTLVDEIGSTVGSGGSFQVDLSGIEPLFEDAVSMTINTFETDQSTGWRMDFSVPGLLGDAEHLEKGLTRPDLDPSSTISLVSKKTRGSHGIATLSVSLRAGVGNDEESISSSIENLSFTDLLVNAGAGNDESHVERYREAFDGENPAEIMQYFQGIEEIMKAARTAAPASAIGNVAVNSSDKS